MNLDPGKMALWNNGRWVPEPPPGIIGTITQDTRGIRGGEVYIALHGERYDGHDFVKAARNGGAVAAIVNADFRDDTSGGWPLLRVADTKRALWDMASGARCEWNAGVVAVTGSVGKTTVKEMIACMAAGADGATPVASTPGNWNNDIGLPLSILRATAGAAFGVFEIGSNRPGEISPLARLLQPAVGVITTVGTAHVEHFGDTTAIAHEKADLLRALPPDGVAVLNCDHAHFELLRAAAPCRVVSVSMQPGKTADYRAVAVDHSVAGETSLQCVCEDGVARRLKAPVSGAHQAANLLLAAAAARQLGIGWDTIRTAIAGFESPPSRWQRIDRAEITIFNDAYNANPESMRAALETFALETKGVKRRWLVLGGMLELGDATVPEHRLIGESVARGEWQGLLTVGKEARDIADAARCAGFAAAVWECRNGSQAAALLRKCLQPGDAVLLKGSRLFKLENIVDKLV